MAKGPVFPLPPPSPDADKRAVRNAIGNLNRWIERNKREVYKKNADILYPVPNSILYDARFRMFLRHIKEQGWMVDVQSLSSSKRIRFTPPLSPNFFEKHKTHLLLAGAAVTILIFIISFSGGC